MPVPEGKNMNQIQRKNKVVDEFELETPAVAAPSNSHPSHAGPVNSDIEVKRSPVSARLSTSGSVKRLPNAWVCDCNP